MAFYPLPPKQQHLYTTQVYSNLNAVCKERALGSGSPSGDKCRKEKGGNVSAVSENEVWFGIGSIHSIHLMGICRISPVDGVLWVRRTFCLSPSPPFYDTFFALPDDTDTTEIFQQILPSRASLTQWASTKLQLPPSSECFPSGFLSSS